MTHNANHIDGLVERLSSLKIKIGYSAPDVFTVYTTSEPLFCFDSHSVDELDALVSNTLTSYAKTFYGIEGRVAIKRSPVVENFEQTGQFEAELDLAA